MNDFKRMSDKELALHIVEYVKRIEKLMDTAWDFMQGKIDRSEIAFIREEYKSLKQSIRDDSRYVNLVGNRTYTDSLYDAFFAPSISEASAFGFKSATNSRIDSAFCDSLEEAHYKLTKYYSLEEWENIAY